MPGLPRADVVGADWHHAGVVALDENVVVVVRGERVLPVVAAEIGRPLAGDVVFDPRVGQEPGPPRAEVVGADRPRRLVGDVVLDELVGADVNDDHAGPARPDQPSAEDHAAVWRSIIEFGMKYAFLLDDLPAAARRCENHHLLEVDHNPGALVATPNGVQIVAKRMVRVQQLQRAERVEQQQLVLDLQLSEFWAKPRWLSTAHPEAEDRLDRMYAGAIGGHSC